MANITGWIAASNNQACTVVNSSPKVSIPNIAPQEPAATQAR